MRRSLHIKSLSPGESRLTSTPQVVSASCCEKLLVRQPIHLCAPPTTSAGSAFLEVMAEGTPGDTFMCFQSIVINTPVLQKVQVLYRLR